MTNDYMSTCDPGGGITFAANIIIGCSSFGNKMKMISDNLLLATVNLGNN